MGTAKYDNFEKPETRNATSLSGEELLSLPAQELLARLSTSANGLSSEEAQERLEVYGRNELPRKRNALPFWIFFHASKAHS